jgi:heme A synthase
MNFQRPNSFIQLLKPIRSLQSTPCSIYPPTAPTFVRLPLLQCSRLHTSTSTSPSTTTDVPTRPSIRSKSKSKAPKTPEKTQTISPTVESTSPTSSKSDLKSTSTPEKTHTIPPTIKPTLPDASKSDSKSTKTPGNHSQSTRSPDSPSTGKIKYRNWPGTRAFVPDPLPHDWKTPKFRPLWLDKVRKVFVPPKFEPKVIQLPDYWNQHLPPKGVSYHLFTVAGLVVVLVLVGGLTRLTESGLSITEWNLVTGVLPPLNDEAWESEFSKYQKTPEFQVLNKSMDLSSFKSIYYMEWGHRILGRLIGLTFLIPLPFYYFNPAIRKWFGSNKRQAILPFAIIGTGIGLQGLIGWWMVKSGLTSDSLRESNPAGGELTPRVSQYRLLIHLGLAFAVGLYSFGTAWKWRIWRTIKPLDVLTHLKHEKSPEKLKPLTKINNQINGVLGLVFVTALSGMSLTCAKSKN